MTIRVSIFGLGYVGSVMAACLASRGVPVVGVDVNSVKVDLINAGSTPIVEPGMSELVRDAHQAGLLKATTDPLQAILESDMSFICVGTPSLRNGNLGLNAVRHVCEEIGAALRQKSRPHTVVVRSTVLPGTCDSVIIPTLEQASGKQNGTEFSLCVNPEFLREGSAIRDFLEPSITVLGAADPSHLDLLRRLYAWVPGKLFETNVPTGEMVKYACNAFHALKVTFANEIATIGREVGADVNSVAEIFCSDAKLNISTAYLRPGFAFGGSCLPKDVRALTYRAKELDVSLPLLQAVLLSNEEHIERAVQAILSTGKKQIGLLGLSFKSGTDDLRESPFVDLIKRLIGEGIQVRIFDPTVCLGMLVGSNREFINETIPHIGCLLSDRIEAVVDSAEVVLIGSNSLDWTFLSGIVRSDQIVIDLANMEKPAQLYSSAAGR
jgi:GDP-mannose 6-dehydrogenase